MANRKYSELSIGEKSKIVFKVLKTQKTQLHSLLHHRNLLQDVIELQKQRYASQFHLLQHQFFQMKRKLTIQEMQRKIDAAKCDMLMGLKQREVYTCQLENADSELGDFREWFDILALKLSELEDMNKFVEKVKRLKSVNEKLTLEKNYTWSQYNEMESRLKEQLQENDAALSDMEELRSSCAEKDHVIEQLKSEMGTEADSINKNEQIFKLSKELESLKSHQGNSVPRLPGRCSLRTGKNNATDNKVVTVNKGSDSQTHGKVVRHCAFFECQPLL